MENKLEYLFAYYQTLRLEARSRVVNDLNKRIKTEQEHINWKGITLASITEEALRFARLEWPRYYTEAYQGIEKSWEHLFFSFMNNKPSNFNIAIWQDLKDKKILRGMALGDCPHGREHLNIRYIERSLAPDYFRGGVLLPILASAEQYAKLLGCKHIFLRGVRNFDEFAKYGYSVYKEGSLSRRCLKKEMCHG